MDIKLLLVSHKKYWFPEDDMYLPIQAGAEGKELIEGFIPDNTEDNISIKNPNYCELTALYWAWKNLSADYCGLVHYRRHFVGKRGLKEDKASRNSKLNQQYGFVLGQDNVPATKKCQKIIGKEELEKLLETTDIILPKKRNYFIDTNYDQYVHAHHPEDLDKTREIISEKYPEYIPAYDESMKKTSGHRFNMFIMKRNYFDEYCQWLFDILFELEKRLDISEYTPYDARVFGFVSERLLDVWINTRKLEYKELPYEFMESQNWLVKGGNFLKRKFLGKVNN